MEHDKQLFENKKYSPIGFYPKDVNNRVLSALARHVYMQTYAAILASLFCAGVIFVGFYSFTETNAALFVWSIFFIVVAVSRLLIVRFYHHQPSKETQVKFWRIAYIVGSLLGGLSWGLAGFILFPYASLDQQMLLMLMLAGVTAGAVPLTSAIPEAAVGFLILCLLPFIIMLALDKTGINLLFDFALLLYLGYTILLTIKSYDIMLNITTLNFQNQLLLKNLSDAKLELEDTNEKLEFAASHDPLTRVANRILFTKNLNRAMEKAKQKNTILGLLYIDLDLFKRVNDIYGHHIGDQVLIIIAERLKSYFHREEIIARLGGDELTVLLENISTPSEANDIAKQVCKVISSPIILNGIELTLSASIGISFYPHDGLDLEALLWRADQFMYIAKQRGGNNFYSEEPVETA